jgi:pimeloyl-ACP methyl ester carboxylesterase
VGQLNECSKACTRTLIVSGYRDPLVPVSIAVELFNAIPHSYLNIIPNGEHLPVFYNLREPFIRTILPFLGEDWEQR